MNKSDLIILVSCLETIQKLGKVEPSAMEAVGGTWNRAKSMLDTMGDQDVLVPMSLNATPDTTEAPTPAEVIENIKAPKGK